MRLVSTLMTRLAVCGESDINRQRSGLTYSRLRADEQLLRKKGRGRLIHVSDFINEEDGCLLQRDSEGNIVRDARKIIYPGSNGDAWWDNNQLLSQVQMQ
jgi:hypothetical protein